MEDRQTQIREGAGLEESKLNVEFIDWLRKWSTPIMGIVAVVALGFVINSRIQKSRAAAIDRAFEELAAASASATPNPETLKSVASENAGVRAVPILAELEAADLYFRSARVGLRLGARPKEDGSYAPEEILTPEQRDANLSQADTLYKKILDDVGSDPKKAVHALGAAFGVAAVAEARGQFDAARSAYEQVIKIAESAGFAGQAEIAKKRIEDVGKLSDPPKLLAEADLPKPPEAQTPGQPAATGSVFDPSAFPSAPTGSAPAATGVSPSPAPTGESPAEAPKTEPTPEAPKPPDPK